MVWHVEGKKTHQSLCVRGKREKRVLRVSVLEKAQSKQKHQNQLLFPFFLSSKTPKTDKPTTISTIPTYKLYMKVSKSIVLNKKCTTAMTSFLTNFFVWASVRVPTDSMPSTQSPKREVGTMVIWHHARRVE